MFDAEGLITLSVMVLLIFTNVKIAVLGLKGELDEEMGT